MKPPKRLTQDEIDAFSEALCPGYGALNLATTRSERELIIAATEELNRLRGIIRATHTTYCTDERRYAATIGQPDKLAGMHAPECLLFEVEP